LIAEDSKADLFLIREAISVAQIDATLHIVEDGHQAVQFVDAADADGDAPRPDLVLLDLNLPRKNGAEVLRHLRNSRCCKDAPVLIVSSSDSARERDTVKSLGFNAYFRKPSAYAEFLMLGPIVRELLEAAGEGSGSRG
jgi:two-component system, chemotaxis family, response regulator Rcp1